MRSKIFNSKAYQVFDYICRLIILNILLIGCSFSIFLIITNIFKDLKEIYQLLLFTTVSCPVSSDPLPAKDSYRIENPL